MPNYNHSRYLRESLGAILQQSVKPEEIIVVDDASTDDSVAIVEEIARDHPIVRSLRNKERVGPAAAVNRATHEAVSEYLYFASADDKVLPGFIETVMATLQRYPQAGLCCSSRSGFTDEDPRPRIDRLRVSGEVTFVDPDDLARLERTAFSLLYPRMAIIATMVSVIKKSALIEAGGHLPELRFWCDGFAYYVVAFRYGICLLPDRCFASYRRSPNTYATTLRRDKKVVREVAVRTFDLLMSPAYQDVMPYFRDSGILRDFGLEGIKPMLGDHKYRGLANALTIRRALWANVRDRIRPLVPRSVERAVRDRHAQRSAREFSL